MGAGLLPTVPPPIPAAIDCRVGGTNIKATPGTHTGAVGGSAGGRSNADRGGNADKRVENFVRACATGAMAAAWAANQAV